MTVDAGAELRGQPFPHLVADGWWDGELLEAVAAEFPHPADSRWIRYDNAREVKLHGDEPTWGERTRELLAGFRARTGELGEVFGVGDLELETVGGGLHLIPPGGFLEVHVDFNRSPLTGRYRRVNLMCYLNRGWVEDGGRLELRGEGEQCASYAPEFNRTVAFESSDRSWHGHPRPAARWRLSVAAYYFSQDPPPGYREDHSTVWRTQ